MAVLNPYSTGRTVYRGTSYAPTRGTVNPSGYVDRELRSKLAQAALRRRGLKKPPVQKLQQPQQMIIDSPMLTPTGQILPQNPNDPTRGRGTIPTPGGFPNRNLPGGLTKEIPGVDPNDPTRGRGTIPTPSIPPLDWANLPFDPEIANQRNKLERQKVDFESELAAKLATLEQERGTSLRTTEMEQPQKLKRALEEFAARGMAQSGGYGVRVGEENDAFSRLKSAIEAGYTGGKNTLETAKNQFSRNYTENLNDLFMQAARNAATKAGELDLDAYLAKLRGGGKKTFPPTTPKKVVIGRIPNLPKKKIKVPPKPKVRR
jgi:hypothetical protein